MKFEKIIPEGIMAILPVYIPMKGNCSQILTYKGQTYEIDKTIRTTLSKLSKIYLVDLKAARKYYGNILNIKNLIPIPFDRENIFIPIKVRRPVCRNDGSIGYVNIKYIDKVYKKEERAIIRLKDEKNIECLYSIDTVNKHIKNGYIIKRLARPQTMEKEAGYLPGEYNKPATKGDIALLISEILRIRESIK